MEQLGSSPPLRQLIYERLQAQIVEGTFPPGHHLVETELAAALGVSRGPVREALHMLGQEGWVDLRPRHGAFVHQADKAEIEEFFHARRVLEVETARLAAARCAEEQSPEAEALLGVLEGVEDQLKRLDDGGTEALARVNDRFHKEIAKLSGNRALSQLLEYIAKRAQWYWVPLVSSRAPEAYREHLGIARAILAGEPDTAATRMAEHIGATRRALEQLDTGTQGPERAAAS